MGVIKDYKTHGKPKVSRQPGNFPLYLNSFQTEDGHVAYDYPQHEMGWGVFRIGTLFAAVAAARQFTAPDLFIDMGLMTAFAGTTIFGLTAMFRREERETMHQLLYFDEDKLIIDNYDGKPEAYDVSKIRLEIIGVDGTVKDDFSDGGFLCLNLGDKRTYFGVYLNADDMADVKQEMDYALQIFPAHSERMKRRQMTPPPSQQPPKPEDFA